MQNPVYADNTTVTGDGTQDNPLSAMGGGGSPGGADTAVQFNDAGSFGGDAAAFFWDKTTKSLVVLSETGNIAFVNGPTTNIQLAIGFAAINIIAEETGATIDLSADSNVFINTDNGQVIISADSGATEVKLQTAEISLVVNSNFAISIEDLGSGPQIGFFGAGSVTKPAVTGSRASGAALVSLLAAFVSLGLITDSTTT